MPNSGSRLMDPMTLAAIIGSVGSLGGAWLNYRGAGRAGDAELEAYRLAQESAERMSREEREERARLIDQSYDRTLGAMSGRYAMRLPLLNRWGTGWPTPQGYEALIRR
jgi:hypothetical protein